MAEIVRAIQDRVLGRRDELTVRELASLFSVEPSPYLITSVQTLIENPKVKTHLDPTKFLSLIIPYIRSFEQLIYVAIALRSGANPDAYILTDKYGELHLLAYTYIKLNNEIPESFLNLIMLMFQKAGSQVAVSVYKTSNDESVYRWLERVGYKFPTEEPTETILNEIGMLLNRVDLVDSSNIDVTKIVKYYSNNITIPYDLNTLGLSIEYLNLVTFKKCLEKGFVPKYILTNKLILMIDGLSRQNIILPTIILRNMLIEGVKYSQQLDLHQFTMLANANQDIATDVETAYKRPYWEKVCVVNVGDVTKRLLRQSASIGLINGQVSKEYLCDQLRQITQADKNRTIDAAIARQKERLAIEHSIVTDFVTSEPKVPFEGVCKMSKTKINSPYEYVDYGVASYRDETGTVWCYTAESFDDLIRDGINPTTLRKLPSSFINKIKNMISMLENLKLRPKDLKPITQALDDLKEPDHISNSSSDRYVKRVEDALAVNNITLVNTLTKEQLNRIVKTVTGQDLSLEKLSSSHAYATFCRVGKAVLGSSPELSDSMITQIRLELASGNQNNLN